MPLKEKVALQTKIFHSLRGLDILEELIDDPSITEIMVNGYDTIFIERGGHMEKSQLKFSSKENLSNIIQQIVGYGVDAHAIGNDHMKIQADLIVVDTD